MRTSTLLAFLIFGSVLPAIAAETSADLDQRLRVLERKLELADEEKSAKAKEAASVSAGEKGFGIKSADGTFELKFRGLLQADSRFFLGDEPPLRFNDTALLRRMEPTFEVTLGKLAYLRLQPQFAGDSVTTSDVYGELRFYPALGLRFGKFKTPLGLEYLQGSGALAFIERGLPTELGAGRDFGLQLQGEVLGGTTTYAIAWLNGAPDGRDAVSTDTDDRKEIAARLFFEPFKASPGFLQGLGFGIAGTTGTKLNTVGSSAATVTANFNNTLPRYRSPGQATIFTYLLNATPTSANTVVAAGTHTRISPQVYFHRGSFGLLAEQVASEQDVAIGGVTETFEHEALQGVLSYVLTGEDAGYRGVRPATPYAVGAEGWGAFEVALRYGVLDIDDAVFPTYANPAASVTEAQDLGVALNWYVTGNVRLALNYDSTEFTGGAAGGADREDEQALFARVQLSF